MGAKRQKDRAEFRFVSALSLSSRRRRKRWACDACDRVSSRASGAQLVRLGVSVSRGRLKLVAVAEIEDWLRRGSSATRGLGSRYRVGGGSANRDSAVPWHERARGGGPSLRRVGAYARTAPLVLRTMSSPSVTLGGVLRILSSFSSRTAGFALRLLRW